MFEAIKKHFNKSAAAEPLSAAEQVLKDLKIRYRKRADGSLFVPGSVNLSG